MTEMTLVDAFRVYGVTLSVEGVEPEAAVRIAARNAAANRAAAVLLRELITIAKHVCREFRVDREHGNDAVQVVLVRLLEEGLMGTRAEMIGGESGARSFLRKAVRNKLIDILRQQGRWLADGDAEAPSEPTPAGNPELAADVADAHRQLVEEIGPGLASRSSRRAASSLLAGIDALCAIQRGTTTVERIASESGRKRSAVDKQFSRIIESLFVEVDRLATNGAVDATQHRHLRVAVEALRPMRNKMRRPNASDSTSDTGDSNV